MRFMAGFAVVAMLALPDAAAAVELGDAEKGQEYAREHCAECHEVEPVESFSPNPDAPSFQEVSDSPGMNARALAVWLRSSHPTMPNLIIPADDMDNVIAYILSLKKSD